jgi:uncharacterized membrane protein YeiH
LQLNRIFIFLRYMKIIDFLSYCGIFVFAITGALKAREKHLDLLGAGVIAFITAFGGGTIRDVLLGIKPVSWLNNYFLLLLIIAAMVIVFLLNENFRKKFRKTMLISDAIGLGLFTAVGIGIGLDFGLHPIYAVAMGVISSTFGGLLADILLNEVPGILIKGELYASCSIVGGIFYITLDFLQFNTSICLWSCTVAVFLLRIISIKKKITLPEI